MTYFGIQKDIPRLYPINLSELQAVILNFASILELEEQVLEAATPLIMEEVYNTLISSNPDRNVPETQNFLNFLVTQQVTIDRFIAFKNGLLTGLNRYLLHIENLVQMWKEHANPYLTWRYSDDHFMLLVIITPVQPNRNFDEILRREVTAAVEAGEFVPYKFLRVLGMC